MNKIDLYNSRLIYRKPNNEQVLLSLDHHYRMIQNLINCFSNTNVDKSWNISARVIENFHCIKQFAWDFETDGFSIIIRGMCVTVILHNSLNKYIR